MIIKQLRDFTERLKDAGKNIIQFDPYYKGWDLILDVPTITCLSQIKNIIK